MILSDGFSPVIICHSYSFIPKWMEIIPLLLGQMCHGNMHLKPPPPSFVQFLVLIRPVPFSLIQNFGTALPQNPSICFCHMSSYEKQEGGKESQSPIAPLESIVTPGIDGHQDCIEAHAVPNLDTLRLGNPPHRLCEGSPARNAVIGEQIKTILPTISQVSRTTPPVSTNPQSRSSTGGKGASEHDSKDMQILCLEGVAFADDSIPPNHHDSGMGIVDGVRKLSTVEHECPGTPDKSQKTIQTNFLEQIPDDAVTAVTTASTTTYARIAPPAHESPIGISLNEQQSKQRTLPRLNLLDLPLLGIAPPNQDTNAAFPTLGRIQGSPSPDAGALSSPDHRDQKETCQIPQTPCPSTDLTCQQPSPLPEPHLITTSTPNAKSTQVDESLDDEVTFIVSVPRRRKKRKRTESSVTNRPAEESVSKSNTATTSNSIRATTTIRSSSVPRASGENTPAISATPIMSTQFSTPATSSKGSLLPVSPPLTTQANKPDQRNLSLLEGTTKRTCDFEDSAPVSATKNEAIEETVQATRGKRKVDQTIDQETAPIKRSKIQNDQPREGRSTDHGKHGIRRYAMLPDSPNATSPNNCLLSSITDSQLQGATAPVTSSSLSLNGHNYLIRSIGSPRSAGNGSPQMPVACHVPSHGALWNLRRKPSLYSIPSWPSPPVSSAPVSPTGSQQRQASIEEANPASITSQVTQTSKSTPSQHAQGVPMDHCISSSMISKVPCSPQGHTATSSQPYTMQPSLDHYNHLANPFPGPNIYAVPTWPAKPFLAVGQQMPKDCLRPQPQRFTVTPQEYARSLHLQYAQSSMHRDSSFQQQSTTMSPQMRSAESSQNPSSTDPSPTMNQPELPSTNLLVDIAQTCQAIFPFARIAERHNQPVKKVFDAFSAIIQIPLLQSAADRRRNGKLGTARLKNFREASKAVSEVHEKERKAEKESAKMRDELAPPPAKKAKVKAKPAGGKGLLGKAIANSQRNASGSK